MENVGITSHGEDTLQSWPFPIPDERYLFRIMVRGDPVPASRPRVLKTGHTYYAKKYGKYRDCLAWYLSGALEPIPIHAFIDASIPADRRRYGVRVVFYRKSLQRCDVDNLIKTVFDAGTGIIWPDDSCVDEVFAKIVRPSSDPRVELLVYETCPQALNRVCIQCAKEFHGFPSSTRPFCSQECFKASLEARRVPVKCKFCGVEFSVLKCVLKHHNVGFCSQQCSLKSLAEKRKIDGSAKWKCVECGAQLKRANNKRCRFCEQIRRGGRLVQKEIEERESLPF